MKYLFLGGDFHGTYREVDDDAIVVKAFASMPTQSTTTSIISAAPPNGRDMASAWTRVASPPQAPALVIQAWVRRTMTATDPVTGEVFRNIVYIHESVADPNQMFLVLANHLAVNWARQGEQVTDA